jgi:chromatin remodeling complex protein RSC6
LIPKICKSTGNCTFDYNIKKCVDKPTKKSHKSSYHKASSHKSLSHTKKPVKKTKHKTKSKSKSKNNSNSNSNMRKATHSVFGKLINSFERIGKEAQTDAQLLKEAKHLL